MDIIHLLPDSIANQIAAGEVIQRPASVVKELMENSIDAGADKVSVIVKSGGYTSIQVTDNGKGMSQTDARMAFERHATSKISKPDDLFGLTTMGFRGEALASVAAVASVELKTRQKDSDFGTILEVSASQVVKQEPIMCAEGTTFIVKNLFFNVPARRKFLKKPEIELGHIITEFLRVALANSEIEFELFDDNKMIYELPKSNFKQRITSVFGKKNHNFASNMLNIEVDTTIVKMFGFVGKPQFAAKNAKQYFFVNSRFMRHPYFHKAVVSAYESMLPSDTLPYYFIWFEVNPTSIDVNIHPQKVEIKFEDEREIWTILQTAVKEALGKFNITPTIDFNTEGAIEIPVHSSSQNAFVQPPKPIFNQNYNPFRTNNQSYQPKSTADNWELLYSKTNSNPSLLRKQESPENEEIAGQDRNDGHYKQISISEKDDFTDFYKHKEKFLITSVKSGLMIIDKQRAEERIMYEKILHQLEMQTKATQKVLFPETMEITAEENVIMQEILPELLALGFEFEILRNSYEINGIPSFLTETSDIIGLLNEIIAYVGENSIEKAVYEKVAIQVAKNYARYSKSTLNNEEIEKMIGTLFRCQNPNFAPDGKKIVAIISDEEILDRF